MKHGKVYVLVLSLLFLKSAFLSAPHSQRWLAIAALTSFAVIEVASDFSKPKSRKRGEKPCDFGIANFFTSEILRECPSTVACTVPSGEKSPNIRRIPS